ncbi:MAG TPA: PEP-CTERM sorting domain-containing protein [Thermoguttaceae bacterium]|nr:PEP-CTERM sorting domain-containing protein [Thermoguttaceae bacterium]
MNKCFYRNVLMGVVVAALTVMTVPAWSETIAEFADGLTNTAVDGYVGMAGGGWAGPWVEGKSTTGAPTATVTVPTINPLNDQVNDNYLNVQVTGSTTGTKFFSTMRDYKGTPGVDVTNPYTIDFKYRVNETLTGSSTFTSIDDRYQIFDTTGATSVGATASWYIGCYGGAGSYVDADMVGKWLLYDGGGHDVPSVTTMLLARQVNTGITVTAGTIYDMHVAVDPTDYTYDVTISSGGTELYNSLTANGGAYAGGLGWRTSASTSPGILGFLGNTTATDDTRKFSVDSIRIVPEPSTLWMVILGGMVLAGVRRRRG